MKLVLIAAAAIALAGGAAHAEDRDFCPDRPGKGSPACTIDTGRLQIETSLIDYAHSRDADAVDDSYVTGDTLLRYGLGDHTEARLGWTAYGFDRSRDRASGMVDHAQGTGDVTLSLRQSLLHPDNSGTAIAIQPSVTLPSGKSPIGAGTWSAGLLVPFGTDLSKDWRLSLDPEVDAAADGDGSGRHLAYSLVAGLSYTIDPAWQISAEAYGQRDDDPAGHQTLASLDLSAAYQLPDKNRQIDLSAYTGLTHATPRIELVLGVAQRF